MEHSLDAQLFKGFQEDSSGVMRFSPHSTPRLLEYLAGVGDERHQKHGPKKMAIFFFNRKQTKVPCATLQWFIYLACSESHQFYATVSQFC